MSRLTIRPATADDAETILAFIQALAEYERELDAVEATADVLREQMSSETPPFECVLAEEDATPVGFALFFQTYSTWRGRPGIWLEDLFVPPRLRGHGVGRALLEHVAGLAVERGCARLEWAVLDWNKSAMAFYRTLGARHLDEWQIWRLTDGPLHRLGG